MASFKTENSIEIQELMETILNPNTNLEEVEEAALGLSDLKDNHNLVNSFLIKQLDKCEPSIKSSIIYSLGKLKSQEAIPKLKNLLNDLDEEIRWVTVEALEKINVEEIVPDLIQRLKQELVPEIKSAIIRTLGNFNTEQVLLNLYRYANCDSDFFVRESAKNALEKISNNNLDKSNRSGNIYSKSNLMYADNPEENHKCSQDSNRDIEPSWKIFSFQKMLEESYQNDKWEKDTKEIGEESFVSIRQSKASLINIISGIYKNSSSTEKEFIELANFENPTNNDIKQMKTLMHHIDFKKLFYISLKIADINANHPFASKKKSINIKWENHKLLLSIYCFDNLVSGKLNVLFKLTTLFRDQHLSPDFDISIKNKSTNKKGKWTSSPYPKSELIFSFDKNDTFDLEVAYYSKLIHKIKFIYN